MSLVRLLVHPQLMANKPLTLTKAWALYRSFAALCGVAMLNEPAGFDAALGALVTPRLASRLFTDACFVLNNSFFKPQVLTTASSEAAKVRCRYGSPATSRGASAERPRVDATCAPKLHSISFQSISAASRASG